MSTPRRFERSLRALRGLRYFVWLFAFGISSADSAPDSLRADIELTANSGAFEFIGDRPAIDLGNSAIMQLSANDYTAMTWVRFNSLTGVPGYAGYCGGPGCDMSILDKMTGYGWQVNQDGWRLLKDSGNQFVFCFGGAGYNGCGGGIPTTTLSQTVVQQDVWYHVAVLKRNMQILLYVNGALEATSSLVAFNDTNSTNLLIGWNAPEGEFLNGKIDDVKLFHKALSDAQVKALYEQSKIAHAK